MTEMQHGANSAIRPATNAAIAEPPKKMLVSIVFAPCLALGRTDGGNQKCDWIRWLPRESDACGALLQAIPRRMSGQQKYPLPRKGQRRLSSVTHPKLQLRNWKGLIVR